MTSISGPQSPYYRYIVAVTLAVTYMFNFLDRQLLSVLAQPIKAELALSDTQLGLLTGLTFALFYTVFGIPIAALADRTSRVRIISASAAIWSVFTAASGFASSFVTLALARVGVGIGEAGCSPPSYSIMSDYFEPEKRGRALAIYTLGVPAGSMLGVALGGWIAANHGWRAAFVTVGLVGLVLTPFIPLIVREPQRGNKDGSGTSDKRMKAQPKTSSNEALAYFFRSPTLVLSAFGTGLTAFVSYGILNWAPAFLGRVQGMTLAQIAGVYSVTIFFSQIIAAWLSALIADRFSARNPMNCALLPGIALLAVTPFLFGFTMSATWQTAMIFLIVPLILSSVCLVPALALLQNRTPARYRATVSALLLFLLNLIGLGLGPLFVGSVSDHLQPYYGTHALGYALQWLTPFIVLAFLVQCATAWSIRGDQRKPRTEPESGCAALGTE